jgi:hypothetical protein
VSPIDVDTRLAPLDRLASRLWRESGAFYWLCVCMVGVWVGVLALLLGSLAGLGGHPGEGRERGLGGSVQVRAVHGGV